MDYLQKLLVQMWSYLIAVLVIENAFIVVGWYLSSQVFHFHGNWEFFTLIVTALVMIAAITWVSAAYLAQPVRFLWRAILSIMPDGANVTAPSIKSAHLGRELITNLAYHIYQLANIAKTATGEARQQISGLSNNTVVRSLPLPLFIADKSGTIVFANTAASKYIGRAVGDIEGQNLNSVLDMSFQTQNTLESWLGKVGQQTATATETWDHVRLSVQDREPLMFDLAAYYNKDNPEGFEIMLIMFDHTDSYSKDDKAMGFIAMAVHELRTPLTLLRGYIEALEDNLKGRTNADDEVFLQKTEGAAQQLATFVNNVLNVARIEDDQFQVQLHEEAWPAIVQSAVNDMQLQARLRGISIETRVADNLPTVGVDRVSIYEVLSNLLDNAVKYSGDNQKILVKAELNSDGLVETSVQDFGVGIPTAVMPHLFNKFYRNHRNRNQIGGTGLGLYLCKTIVNAHGGNIWVRSQEGVGTMFSFTVKPYNQLAEEMKGSEKDFTRTAHGWIKNHSLYRR